MGLAGYEPPPPSGGTRTGMMDDRTVEGDFPAAASPWVGQVGIGISGLRCSFFKEVRE